MYNFQSAITQHEGMTDTCWFWRCTGLELLWLSAHCCTHRFTLQH